MNKFSNNKATPSKDTGAKGRSSNKVVDYKYNPRVENPNPKASTDKAPSAGNIRGV